jgi:hypothetical protein
MTHGATHSSHDRRWWCERALIVVRMLAIIVTVWASALQQS